MLDIRDLTFRYRRRSDFVLRDLNWTFRSESMTAVTAPSGCGKSTLLWLLGLMLKPTSGSICWRGGSLSELTDAERAKFRSLSVGFVFQDAVLDTSRTVLDNVLEGALYGGMTRREAMPIARSLLERFAVQARADHLPGEISGGQAQRVALCRALVKSPKIVLADEPSGNLDQQSGDVVWAELARVAREHGAVVVVASHDRHRLSLADDELDLGSG